MACGHHGSPRMTKDPWLPRKGSLGAPAPQRMPRINNKYVWNYRKCNLSNRKRNYLTETEMNYQLRLLITRIERIHAAFLL